MTAKTLAALPDSIRAIATFSVGFEHIDLAAAELETVKAAKITRIGEPEDIAALVAFIVGPEGRLLQGAMIDMDAGSTKTL